MLICIGGQKGGVGKTTIAVNLATEWHARGHRVLVVDADPQASASTWAEVAAEEGRPAPTVVAMGERMHRPDQLPALAKGYDRVLIDCPPRLGPVLKSALMVADLVVLPCGPSPLDFWALTSSVDLIEEARIVRPELLAAVLVTRMVTGTRMGAEAKGALEAFKLPILRTTVGYRSDFAKSLTAGMGVTEFASSSSAASEVRSLANEIEAFSGETAEEISDVA